jgi:predicted metal-dependent hydrolase
LKAGKDNIHYVEVFDYRVPLEIISERRNNLRVALGSKTVLVRIPFLRWLTPGVNPEKWVQTWLHNLEKKKPGTMLRFDPAHPANLDRPLKIMGHSDYHLQVRPELIDRATLIKNNDKLEIYIPQETPLIHVTDMRIKLLGNYINKNYKAALVDRVFELNHRFFQEEISTVFLKNAHSKWGSCTAKKNINISIRTLLLPSKVIDYIIIHELSHLIEMNHSNKFWKVVEGAMPDYKECERWLNANGTRYYL